MIHDLQYAIRLLRKSPGVTAIAVITVALAIGATTAMFSFVNGVLLRPLPYPDSRRIVRILERAPGGATNAISTLNYLDWASQSTVFEDIAAEAAWRPTLTGGDEPVLIQAALVSAHYFDIFETKPTLGRTFRLDDDEPGRDRVILLSHALWERRFSADSAILERQIVLNGEAHTVIGVLPKGGPFDRASAQIWKPLAFQPSDKTRNYRWLAANAKLKPGVTLGRARAEMNVIGQRIAGAHPDTNKGWGVAVDRLADVVVSPDLQTAVTVLFTATGFVLLIACANLANLALARSSSRGREMAVRAAIGASRGRLVRQCLVENVVIASAGGVAGTGVAYGLLKWIHSLIPPSALPPAVEISMDAPVLLFTFFMAVVTGLLAGAAPAAQMTTPNLTGGLRAAGAGASSGRAGRRVRGLLVVAEVALAFALLVASGLLMRSVVKLLAIDPGFNATDALTAGLPLSQKQHPDPVELNAYLASISAAVEAVPGVRRAAFTSTLPLQGSGFGVSYAVADRGPVDRSSRRRAFFTIVSPSYFDTLGIRLLAGRLLNEHDRAGSAPVAVINQTLARREFLDGTPIGRRLLIQEIVPGKAALGETIAWDIVGVVGGEKITGLGDEITAGLYVSHQQSPTYGINLVVRADVPPHSLRKPLRSAIDTVNKDQALSDVRTLVEIVDRSLLANRVTSTLILMFASLALVLAAGGIYGVISYAAVQRTQEMGIRAALGATAVHLRALVFLSGMRLTMVGLLVGLAGTFATASVISSMLYGVGTRDPLTIAIAAGVLGGVAALASVLPAWRMTRRDPMDALRHQ